LEFIKYTITEGCPTTVARPKFTEANYSVSLSGVPVIGSIYCLQVSNNSAALAYLNLPSGAENNYLHGKKTSMK